MNEKTLVTSLVSGSEASFRVLYDLWSSKLYHFAYLYLKSDAASKDIVQETFVKIWTNRETINTESPFKSYLFTISYHFILKELRRQVDHPQMEEYLDTKKSIVLSADNIELQYDFDLFLKELMKAKQKLSPRQSSIFTLNKECDMSIAEIAAKYSITEQVVRNQLSASLKILRKELTGFSVLFLFYIDNL
jgi:RNA polymerase sigma-70 factor (ECF subfamily)